MPKECMDELYGKHSQMIYHFFLRMGECRETAEELTQETFYQAFLSYHRFRGECRASTWLYQIAKNVWAQYLRKKKKNLPITEELGQLADGEGMDPLQAFLRKEEKDTLRQALQKLTEEMRSVVVLRITEELSFAEIGSILGRSETWSRTNFYRAKKKLREIIREKGSAT